MKAIILAAGFGTRTSRQLPKCLIRLPDGKTIFENQIGIFRAFRITELLVVVGFKKEIIMENYPEPLYRYNPIYHITNTAKSLMNALESIVEDDIIWINGDVVLEEEVLRRLVSRPGNLIAVNKIECGAEEIKYVLNEKGQILRISKEISNGVGEAMGINKICKKDFNVFLESLKECEKTDYFEKAIELSISKGVVFYPVNMTGCKCIEVDFHKDLEKVFSYDDSNRK